MHRDNWDDLRFVLAVAETGSVSGAARRLGVNHATVIRRVAAFEESHGTELFERTAQGYQIPVDRQKVIDAAREVRDAVESVGRMLRGAEAQLSGVVRVTSTDTLCARILPQIVGQLLIELPEVRIELLSTNAHLDLSQLHADITIRPAQQLTEMLIGERSGELRVGVYAPKDKPEAPWLTLRGALSRSLFAGWVEDQQINENIDFEQRSGSDSFISLKEMVGNGLGRCILPHCIARHDPRLVLQEHDLPFSGVPLWVASHVDLRDSPRLRGVRKRLAEMLRTHPDLM